MKRWKWKMTALLALVLVSLGGCGKKGEGLDPNNPTSLVVWHYYNGTQKEAFDELVSRYNDTQGAEKGVIVSAESKGDVDELTAAVLDSAEKKVGADELPDVFAAYVDTAYSFYQKDLLVDLMQYMTKEETEEYMPAFVKEGELTKGGLFVMPVAKSTELFYLNETDWSTFAEETGAKVSELSTWEGLARISEQYYEWSGGKAFFGRDAFANYLIIGSHQLGKDIFQVKENKMTVQLDDEVMRRLWDGYAAPYLKGYYGAYGRFRSDDVKTGDLVACVGSTSSVSYYPEEVAREDGTTYPIEGVVLPLPNFEGTEACSVQQGAGMAVIRSEPVKEQAAADFLKWFTDVEQNSEFCARSGYLPVKSKANKEENMEKALEAAGVEKESLLMENARIGVKAFNEAELYTNPPFEEGNACREVLTQYMTQWLDEKKGGLQKLGEAEREKRIEQLYQEWVAGLQEELSQ